MVSLGNGKLADFWRSSWLHGQAPANLAPTLFGKARRKKISVHGALCNNYWARFCAPILSETEIHEFVKLCEDIAIVTINLDIEDQITWRWTADGQYSTRSAYKIQFAAIFCKMKNLPNLEGQGRSEMPFFCMDSTAQENFNS